MARNVTTFGIALAKDLLVQIDAERGDVSRSRFLRRIIEANYQRRHKQTEGGH